MSDVHRQARRRPLDRRLALGTLTGFLVVTALMLGFVEWGMRKQIDTEIRSKLGQVEVAYASVINGLGLWAQTIFDETIDTPETLALVAAGIHSEGEARDRERRRLLEALGPTYARLHRNGLRQLHFHTPDGRSYLRFHKPEKYGDTLADIRDSIRITNAERRPTQGFESGRVLHGFRFLFPLLKDGEHLGSVEISFPFQAIEKELNALTRDEQFLFVLNKASVFSKIFDSQRPFYSDFVLNPDYVIENAGDEAEPPPPSVTSLLPRVQEAMSARVPLIRERMASGEPFGLHQTLDHQAYSLFFVPVRNVAGTLEAFVIALGEAPQIALIQMVGRATQGGLALILAALAWFYLERRRYVQELEQAWREAERSAEVKSQFLANMSHEIRTPLNAVLGLTQILEQSPLNADQRELLEQIQGAGRSLLGLINDILDFSRIDSGRLQLDLQPFNLPALLAHLGALLGATAHAKGLELRLEPSPDIQGALLGDALRLEQILTNLIGNAVKFTEQGVIEVRCDCLERTETAVRLRFSIRDSGIGMSESTQAGLFQPFTQADAGISRRFGGTGLGLSICKRLVELMGGTIGVESREGVGSTFWFELSLEHTPEPVMDQVRPPGVEVDQHRRLAGLRLLVVDDVQLNLKVVERMLALEGASAATADNGRQALERLRAEPAAFDAVLMDVQMPVMDGLSATRAIRDELGLSALPIIALTAGVMSQEQQRTRQAGCNDFLPKPVELEQLVEALRRWTIPSTADTLPKIEPASSSETEVRVAGIVPERLDLLCQGDEDCLRRLLQGFAGEMSDLPARLQAELDRGDRLDAAQRLHRLRGVAANLGALELAEQVSELERAIRAGQPSAAGVAALAARLLGLSAAIESGLASLESQAKPAPPGLTDVERDIVPADRLDDLRAALRTHRPRPARRLFAELETVLEQRYGRETLTDMAADLDALRFDELLERLESDA